MEGTAKTDISKDEGTVYLHGELWSAYSDESIPKGDKVVVENISGLRMKVKKTVSVGG